MVIGLFGCSHPTLTQILVTVDTDLEVPSELTGVHFRVRSPRGEEREASANFAAGDARPAVLSLLHAGGPLGPFTVEVSGVDRSAPVVERSAQVSFIPGRVVVLPMNLWRRCVGVTCAASETCGDAGCRSVEVTPGELMDWGDDGGVDDGGVDDGGVDDGGVDDGGGAGEVPAVNAASYDVVAHGGSTTLSGAGLSSTSSVTIGGHDVPFTVLDDASIRIDAVPDSVPTGPQTARVHTSRGSASIGLTVVHLVLGELDEATDSGTDVHQFVEIDTGGLGDLSLAGYVLVAFGADHTAYLSVPLERSDASGRAVIGDAALDPDILIADAVIESAGAAALYQRHDVPDGTAPSAEDLIDALVYARDGSSDSELEGTLLLSGSTVSESGGWGSDLRSTSLQRCHSERRSGDAWRRATATPGESNQCRH